MQGSQSSSLTTSCETSTSPAGGASAVLKGGIGQTLTGTVRRDKVFQYAQAVFEVGGIGFSMISDPDEPDLRGSHQSPSNQPAA